MAKSPPARDGAAEDAGRDAPQGRRAVGAAERHGREARRRESDRPRVSRPARPWRPDDGRPAGRAYRAHHRRDDGGHRPARTRRLRPTSPQHRGSAQRARRGAARIVFSEIEALYQPLAVAVARLNEEYGDRQLAVVVDYLSRAVTLAAEHVVWLQTQPPLTSEAPVRRPRRRRAAAAGPAPESQGHAGMTRITRAGAVCAGRGVSTICTSVHTGRTEPAMRDRRRMFLRAVGALCAVRPDDRAGSRRRRRRRSLRDR